MKRFILILIIAFAALYVVWPQRPGSYIPGGDLLPGSPGVHIGGFDRQGARLGLDLQGGTQLTLQADMSNVPSLPDRYRRSDCVKDSRVASRSKSCRNLSSSPSSTSRSARTASSSADISVAG